MGTTTNKEDLITLINKQKEQTFHLGLTMAGAVSAGAYTGGVIDYLMQTLDRWQLAKKANNDIWNELERKKSLTEEALREKGYDFRIPMHNVVIDAIGGASAGGMTSTMLMMAAVDKEYKPVETLEQANDPEYTKHNIFYESWVRLLETQKEKAIDLMLHHTDLVGKGIASALNVDIIDKLADQAFKNIDKLEQGNLATRPYISEKVELLLTLTTLRGIQIAVEFSASEALQSASFSSKLRHNMYTHTLVTHFVMNHACMGGDKWQYLDMKSDLLRQCSIATGAFPFGLKARHIKGISYYYIQSALNRSFSNDVYLSDFDPHNDFEFIAVDGGTMNNEPYSEVYNVVEKASAKTRNAQEAQGCVCHGLIMIDPFPNYADEDTYELKELVTDLPGALFGSLREQSMVKDSSAINKKYSRWMIVPIKWKNRGNQYQYPLCCSSLGAFGGFFDEEFRKHDFFLGRNNCQNFLKRYFTIKYDEKAEHKEPIHAYWTDEMRAIFKTKDATAGDVYLQIIPDLSMLSEANSRNPFDYTYKEYPEYNIEKLKALKPLMQKRINLLLKELQEYKNWLNVKQKAPTAEELTEQAMVEVFWNRIFPKFWIAKKYNKYKAYLVDSFSKTWLSKQLHKIPLPSFAILFLLVARWYIARKLSRKAIEVIVADFHKQGLLGNSSKKVVPQNLKTVV